MTHYPAIECPEPTPLENGEINVNASEAPVPFGINTIITYLCDNGYGLSNEVMSSVCLGNGSIGVWSEEIPICEGKMGVFTPGSHIAHVL